MSGARPLPLDRARGPSREQALAVGRALHVARVARGDRPRHGGPGPADPPPRPGGARGGRLRPGRGPGPPRRAAAGLRELSRPRRRPARRAMEGGGRPPRSAARARAARAGRGTAPRRRARGRGAPARRRGGLRRPPPARPGHAGLRRAGEPRARRSARRPPRRASGSAATATGEGADIAAPVSPPRPGAAEAPAEETRAGEVGSGPAPATPVPDGGPAPPEGAGIVLAAAGVPGPVGLPPAPPDGRGGGPPGTGDADPAPVPEPSPAPATSPTGATGKPVADGPHAGPVPAAMVGPPLAPADDEEGAARVGDAAPAGVPPRVGVPPASPPRPGAGRSRSRRCATRSDVSGEWRRAAARHPGLTGLQPRDPQVVEVPGRGTFWRVLAGSFATRAEAEAACDRLRDEGGACRAAPP